MSWVLPVAVVEVEESLEPWFLGGAQGTLLIVPGHNLIRAMKKLSLREGQNEGDLG